MSNVNIYNKTNQIIIEQKKDNTINIINEQNNSRETNIQENKFIEPHSKIIWKGVVQNSYHFKQDIERVWLFVKNFDLLTLINNKGHYPCICTKGNETWKVGNEFKGNLFSKYPFIARVIKSESYPEIKTIKWLLNVNKKQYTKIKFELYKVTEDNTCVIVWKIYADNEECLYYNPELKNGLFPKIEKILESEPINLFQFESGIIRAKMKDIWNLLTDFNKLTAIAPNNNCLPNVNIGNLKPGEKVTSYGHCCGRNYEIDITLEYKDERPCWNKWLFVLLISGGVPKKHPKHTVIIELTKISEEECQLIFVSKFHESIDTKTFQDISRRKKYLLFSLKDYFDNFYSPINKI
jgi:hypothetical protein